MLFFGRKQLMFKFQIYLSLVLTFKLDSNYAVEFRRLLKTTHVQVININIINKLINIKNINFVTFFYFRRHQYFCGATGIPVCFITSIQ